MVLEGYLQVCLIRVIIFLCVFVVYDRLSEFDWGDVSFKAA